jgi:hypothetical protein
MKTDKGLFLCAVEVRFQHPVTRAEVHVEIPMPGKWGSYFDREMRRLGKYM